MLGDVARIADNLWLVLGELPADIPNCVIYQKDSRLYLLDSGAGRVIRSGITRVLQLIGHVQSFTLLNSHGHADHVGNNDLIQSVDANETHHYISKAGIDIIDHIEYFTDQFYKLSENYNPANGFQAHKIRWRFLGLLGPLLMLFIGEKRVLKLIFLIYFRTTLRHMQPIRPSLKTIQTYESLPSSTLRIGKIFWTGWILGENDVWVLKADGHTPDEVLFYLPEHRLLYTGDLTLPLFPTFPISNGKTTREMLHKCEEMASSGSLSMLIDGHHPQAYQGKEEIAKFLSKLLIDQEHFQTVLRQIVEEHKGLTIGQIYGYVLQLKGDPVIQHYLALEYPYLPMALQQIIAVSLVQMGYEGRGQRRKKRFYPPSKNA